MEAVLGGFDDAEEGDTGADAMEDVLSGFGDDDDFAADASDAAPPPEAEEPFWDLTGSVSVDASGSYLPHNASGGTDYQGLSRLRTRLNLQLDVDLPLDWKLRAAGFAFYDWAYLIEGRGRFSSEVLDTYEWESDFQDFYLQGSLHEHVDLKLGRQVVNWGRSDSLRVLDVINPLDNREPGLADLEDLRRPVAMARVDAHWGDWSLSMLAVPEIRFDKNPPFGSDFFPAPDVPLLPADVFEQIPERVPDEFSGNTEFGVGLTGIFRGWDISFHFARFWQNTPYFAPNPVEFTAQLGAFLMGQPADLSLIGELKHSRVLLYGAGGNYTWGNWLFKGEIAWLDGIDYTLSTDTPQGPIPSGTTEKARLDLMGGVEYYGFTETTIALEVVNRRIRHFEGGMRATFAQRNALETALRITSDFLNARLHVTLLGIAFGETAQDGSIIRLSADYDLRDALVLGIGLLLFQDGDLPPFSSIARNDRLFGSLKYSF